jgi:hypothetical protein
MDEYREAPTGARTIRSPNAGAAIKDQLICEWRRNSCERIRISLTQYNGCDVVDVRTWVIDAKGELRPTKSGITLASQKHLPALAQGLANALKRARELGIVSPESDGAQP